MPFSSNLEYLMKYFNVTNYRLAKYLGVSQTSVKNWISGERLPHYKTQKMIADLFGIAAEELTGDSTPHITGPNILPFKSKKSSPPDGDELPDVWYQLSDEGRAKAMEYMDFLKAQQDKR